jgi:hypothetical protein
MTPAANQQYQNTPWGTSGNNQQWSGPPIWHPAGIGRPIIIAGIVFLAVAGHIGRMLFWPLAIAGLVFMVATGRIGCRRRWGQNNWSQNSGDQSQGGNAGWCMPSWGRAWGNWGRNGGGGDPTPPSSGNHAFDEYRAATLRRLEEEQNEFSSFLERLRFAKDKAEFDQFMADRRQNPHPPTVQDDPAHT